MRLDAIYSSDKGIGSIANASPLEPLGFIKRIFGANVFIPLKYTNVKKGVQMFELRLKNYNSIILTFSGVGGLLSSNSMMAHVAFPVK